MVQMKASNIIILMLLIVGIVVVTYQCEKNKELRRDYRILEKEKEGLKEEVYDIRNYVEFLEDSLEVIDKKLDENDLENKELKDKLKQNIDETDSMVNDVVDMDELELDSILTNYKYPKGN